MDLGKALPVQRCSVLAETESSSVNQHIRVDSGYVGCAKIALELKNTDI